MANVLLGWPIYSDVGVLYTPTLSGGSWETTLPRTNLQDDRLHRVARTTNDATTSTVVAADLGVSRAMRVFGLVNHNLSAVTPTNGDVPRVRVRAFAVTPILDAGGDGYSPFGTGWSSVGTPTRVANNFACTDGVYLDLIGDDAAGAAEGYSVNLSFTGNAQKVIAFRIEEGTSTSTLIRLRDATAGAERLLVAVTWSAGVPTATATTGTVLSTTAIGGGAYRIVCLTASVTAANTNSLFVYPAETTAIAGTLTGTVHVGDIAAFNTTTDPLAYDSGMTRALPAGSTAETREGWVPTWWHVTPSDITARYVQININDDNNPDGYIQVGRLIVAGGIQPDVNMSNGATLGYTTTSTKTETDGGAFIKNRRARRREATLLLEMQTESDAYGELEALQRIAGTTEQLAFFFDPDDDEDTLRWKRSFLGTLRELSPIQHPYPTYHATPFAITEEL